MNSTSKWDDKLKAAIWLYHQRELAMIPPDDQINIIPSETFETNMQNLIDKQQKPYFYLINTVGKRVAIIVVVLFSALITTVFSVEALRKPVVEFFVTIFEQFSTVIFGTGTEQDTNEISSDDFYIPAFTFSNTSLASDSTIESAASSLESLFLPDKHSSTHEWTSSISSESVVNTSQNTSSTKTSHDISGINSSTESSQLTISSNSSKVPSSSSASSDLTSEMSFPTTIEQTRLPTIPEGYVLDYEEKTDFSYYAEYVNEEDDFFSFEQYIIQSNKITIDIEDVVPIKIKVNEFEAVYYENKGFGNIIWSDGIYGYTLIGLPNQEFLLIIAQSVN